MVLPGGRPRPAGGEASEGGARATVQAGGGCSSAHAGPRVANFCGLRGGGSRCVGRRSPARTGRPQLRVQRSPAAFVPLRS